MKLIGQLKRDDLIIHFITHLPRQMIQENARGWPLSE